MKKIKLSNGVEMPQLGYGVYQVEPDPTSTPPTVFSSTIIAEKQPKTIQKTVENHLIC